jgi:hypothetical protein
MVRRTALGLLAVALAACLDLQPITAGTCGNSIIDPGEDCDGAMPDDRHFAGAGGHAVCGAAGSARACRFDCSRGVACPETYHCGADGICRQPSGQFGRFSVIPASPAYVHTGDFDGDGRDDLLTMDGDTGLISVHFFERDGVLSRTFTTPSDGALPAIGQISAPGVHDDFTLNVQTGLGVMQGQPDRSFVPTPFPAITQQVAHAYLVALEAIPVDDFGVPRHSDDVLILLKGDAGAWMAFSPQGGGTPRFSIPSSGAISDWIPRLPVGHFDTRPSVPCETMVLVAALGKEARVLAPCVLQGGAPVWNDQTGTPYTPVALSDSTARISAAIAAHVNPGAPGTEARDDLLDLVLSDASGKAYVAYGRGDGTFSSAPPPAPADGLAKPAPWADATFDARPLAIADLNHDGAPDLVLPSGIYLSKAGALPTSIADYQRIAVPPGTAELTEAVIVDFNGDGWEDVVAASAGSTGVALYTNTGTGAFNADVAATERAVSQIVVGDFDGDLRPDVAFRQSADGALRDGLWIMYGRYGEPPISPAPLGALPHIAQIVAGTDLMHRSSHNAFADMAVLSDDGTTKSGSIFAGRPDRLLQSPFSFRLAGENISETLGPNAVAMGHFHGATGALGVAAVVLTDGGCGGVLGTVEPRLWRLEAGANADLHPDPQPRTDPPATPTLCATSGTLAWETAALVAADVRKRGGDDLVMLVRNPGKDAGGALFVVDGAADVLTPGEPIALPAEFSDARVDPAVPQLRRTPPMCIADIDGDGSLDLVALASDGAGAGQVVVLWGEASASPPFSGDRLARVQHGGATLQGVTSLACTDADGDGAADIVVLTQKGMFMVDGAKGRALGATELQDPETETALPGGYSIASGDIDGDGLSDLAVAGTTGIVVYLGRPVIQ